MINAMLTLSFFMSGCSALIYQVCWQRALYGVIGVDMDSITIIVSVFMLGIGTGGMLGGWLSDRYPNKRLLLYAGAELLIAVYGATTLWLLIWLDEFLTNMAWAGSGLSALACFAFLIIPTTLMGVTLPLLTMTFNKERMNIGVSVGILYFFNTMGAATGATLVPFILLPVFNLNQVVWLAVMGNLVVALCAMLAGHKEKIQTGTYA